MYVHTLKQFCPRSHVLVIGTINISFVDNYKKNKNNHGNHTVFPNKENRRRLSSNLFKQIPLP